MSPTMSHKTASEIILDPYKYITKTPGKQIRKVLIEAFNEWLHVPLDKMEIIAEIVQMVHNASLMLDDIEDNSELRRGQPVTHHIFGIPQTMNSANFMAFKAVEIAYSLGHPDAPRIVLEQNMELHLGQGMELYWRDAHVCPTEDQYKTMVRKKTGGLFCMALKLMLLFGEHKIDLRPLTDAIGVYFQIRDDYANLVSKEYEKSKTFAEDLTEGKFSFPIIHGIMSNPNDCQVMYIVKQKPKDVDMKKYCIEKLRELGSLEYTREVLVQLEERLLSILKDLGGNARLEGLVKTLSKVYKQEE